MDLVHDKAAAPTADYRQRRIPVPLGALDDVVSGWISGPGVPPLFIEARDGALDTPAAALDWLRANRVRLDDLILEHGGIMLRGFPVTTPQDFNAVIAAFPTYAPGYVGGMSPRKKVAGQVLESTRLDPDFKIYLHSEMAYMKAYPPRIAFFCAKAAPVGGETIIGTMRAFMERLPDDLHAKLDRHSVHVVRNLAAAGNSKGKDVIDHPDNLGWDDAFYTDDRAEVEARCREMGMEPHWNANGSLTLIDVGTVFTTHPVTGQKCFRNNLHTNLAFESQGFNDLIANLRASQERPTGHYLDDGTMLSREESAAITSILEEIELAWPWQDGDIMILDNLQVMHGRNPFSGPREVVVALLS